MNEPLLHFVETSVFSKRLNKLTTMDVLFDLQNDLMLDPKRGAVIQGTSGARKARIGEKGKQRGKSGSFRYIYVYLERAETIYLLVFYGKAKKDTLSKSETNELAEIVRRLKRVYGE